LNPPAVIRQALYDRSAYKGSKNKKHKELYKDAVAFLNGDGLEYWCELCGLDAKEVRMLAGIKVD